MNRLHFFLTNTEERKLFEILEDRRMNRELKRRLENILFPKSIEQNRE